MSGFDVVSQDTVLTTSYSGEDTFSMKPEYYTVPLDVFRLARKEDIWPINGHRKSDISVSSPPKETAPVEREILLQTPNNKEKKLREEFFDRHENCNSAEPWIRTNFIIKK